MAPAELERLYDAHAQALFAFVLNLTRSEPDTRDVLQEVFVKLATRPQMLDGVRDERGFLLRVAHNLAVSSMRRRDVQARKHEQFGAETESMFAPVPDGDEQAFRNTVAAAMAELLPEQRAVMHLKIWEDMTFDAIAAALDIPANTAASRYRYAIDKLRHHLRPLYDEMK
jgi:RNA polymerase sigma-70 factor (ECF subfamily)